MFKKKLAVIFYYAHNEIHAQVWFRILSKRKKHINIKRA